MKLRAFPVTGSWPTVWKRRAARRAMGLPANARIQAVVRSAPASTVARNVSTSLIDRIRGRRKSGAFAGDALSDIFGLMAGEISHVDTVCPLEPPTRDCRDGGRAEAHRRG